MTEMISWAINMRLPLLRGAVLTQNLAFPFIYLFFAWSESLYGSLRAGEAKSLLKPSQLYLGLQIMKTFPVHKVHKSAIKMKKKKKKKGIKSKRLNYIFMHWQLYWVQHNGTLFLHEAIWNLFIHRGNESFPVVFEPAVMTSEAKKKKSELIKGQISVLKNVTQISAQGR